MGGVLPKIFQNTLVLLNKKYVVQDRIIIIKCNIHPTFGVLYKKAPQTPQMGCFWGAKTSPTQDVKYFDFLPQKCGILLQFTKKFDYPNFLVGLIYRLGKGPKFKNICINVTFSYTIYEFFFFFFTFFLLFFTFLTFWGENITFWG